MRIRKWLLMFALLTISSVTKANIWVEGQYGSSDTSEHTILGMELNVEKDNKIFSLGLTENTACYLFCFDDVFYSDLYFAYGTRKQLNSNFGLTRQIGISFFRRADFGCDDTCDDRVLGIPLDLGLMTFGKYAGLGLNLRVNLNSIDTTTTLTLSMALGRIK